MPAVVGAVSTAAWVGVVVALVVGRGAHQLAHAAALTLAGRPWRVSAGLTGAGGGFGTVLAINTDAAPWWAALAPALVAAPAVALLAVALSYPEIQVGSLLVLVAWVVATAPTPADWRVGRSRAPPDGLAVPDRRVQLIALGETLALAALLRVSRLGAESYYIDETITLWYVRHVPALELVWRIPARQPHVPLYYLLLDGWVALVGVGEGLTRAPSVAFSVAMVAALYGLGRALADGRVGLLAAGITAVAPYQVVYAQWTRMYALVGLLAVLTAWATLRYGRRASRRRGLTWVACAAALAATHVYGWFLLVACSAWLLARRGRAAVWPVASGAALALPWAAIMALKTVAPGWYGGGGGAVYVGSVNGAFPHLPSTPTTLAAVPGWLVVGYAEGALAIVSGAVVLAGLWWAVPTRRRPTPAGWLLAAWVGVPVALALVVSVAHPAFRFKYLAVVAPGLYLAVAVGVVRQRRAVVAVVLAVLVATAGVGLVGEYATDRHRPYDDAVAAIDAPGPVVATGGPRGPQAYYLERIGYEYTLFQRANGTRLVRATHGACRVWLLYDWPGDVLGEHLNRSLANEYDMRTHQSFGRSKRGHAAGVRVVEYTKPGCPA